MLAMCDKRGRVWASIPGLASRAKVTIDETKTALECFLSPDEYSRTQDYEGRKIEVIDGGWSLLNHAKYRALRDEEERRNYKTAKQREYRAVDNVDKSGQPCTSVDARGHNAEADTEAEKRRRGAKRAPTSFVVSVAMYEWAESKLGMPASVVQQETAAFLDHEFDKAKKDWQAVWRNWLRRSNKWQTAGEVPKETTEDHAAKLGLTKRPRESDEAFKSRVCDEMVAKQYGL